MKSIDLSFVAVGGYRSSGGTAVLDVLKEVETYSVPNVEFRLFCDPYGLIDLQTAIFERIDPEKIDIACKDFLWLTESFFRTTKRFSKTGLHYEKHISPNFKKLSDEYINEISQFKYLMHWHILDFKKSFIKDMYHRYKKKITSRFFEEEAYYCYPSLEEFYSITQNYLEKIFQNFSNQNKNVSNIALHNAIPYYNYNDVVKCLKYHKNFKAIIVDSDPRDVFLRLPVKAFSRYLNPNKTLQVENFINFFKITRQSRDRLSNHPNIKLIMLEDLVLNYKKTINGLFDFLNIDFNNHIYQKKYFDPSKSKNEIMLWKKISENSTVFKEIEKKLNKYLYS